MLFIGVVLIPFLYAMLEPALMALIDTSYLERSIENWFTGNGDSIFNIMTIVMNYSIKPVAYTILAVFFALELYKMSMKIEGVGGNPSLGVEPVFRSLIKLAICKLVVDHSGEIILAMQDISIYCINKMEEAFKTGSYKTDLSRILKQQQDDLMSGWDLINFPKQIFVFVEGTLIVVCVLIASGLVKIMTMARMVELLIYYTLSPIALSTFPSDEFSQIGKNYLKNVAALCFQGVILFLILNIYGYIVGSFLGNASGMMDLLIYSICVALAATSTGRLAKSMFNAS